MLVSEKNGVSVDFCVCAESGRVIYDKGGSGDVGEV